MQTRALLGHAGRRRPGRTRQQRDARPSRDRRRHAADQRRPAGRPIKPGGNVVVCLQYDGRADVDRHFAALSEGGTVAEPLQDTFWGARFGLLVDRFGIHWMFNATLTE